MIAEPLEKGLAEDIEDEVVQITWPKYVIFDHTPSLKHCLENDRQSSFRQNMNGIYGECFSLDE